MFNFIQKCMVGVVLGMVVSSCADHNGGGMTGLSQTSSDMTTTNKGAFNDWHQMALQSRSVIGQSKPVIQKSYDSLRNFDKKSLSTSWLDIISSQIAQNKTYRASILEAAGSDKVDFANSLLKTPKSAWNYNGANTAFIDGLKKVEMFDYDYRTLSNSFEDSARGRAGKTKTFSKNISNVVIKPYVSQGQSPSVAEQLLAIAAVKILGLENNSDVRNNLSTTLSNGAIERCLFRSQQNSAQCQAASYDKNDLSFCMAKHTIGETSKCFSWILP